ncbi:hypothetical protein ACWT_2493 [Actinoplanes sp. SE50]|uniref:hypothetical protein n=1 Tax=unclassified Actinoplanes TaxID=2626549 RepID=UPI00023ED5D7|nr:MULTISPECIES: hypothetical protein [unclassified Actinoplanes]AEV83948.1 hypothetical protein ACPL_3053 [Actinoplanes sp. SE50/110]ATO81908.1 hypothetical protein ACWT_2493 [Actinoplanes sp. SE50]SLL99316.1 uncharacterized protein ACSP50_2547 [Actinoplanes sp. SE50/110]
MTTLPSPPLAAPLTMPRYARTSDRLSNTTRYLCTAAFLVRGFADQVVDELIGEMRRSVPPSHGYDLDPIVRQCFRVRRRHLYQQLCATVLYLAALLLSPPLTLTVTGLGLIVRLARSVRLRAFLARHRLGFLRWWVAWFLAGMLVGLPLTLLFSLQNLFRQYLDENTDTTGSAAAAAATGGGGSSLLALLCLLAIVGVTYAFRRDAYRVVTTEFAPDVAHARTRLRDTLVEDRLAMIAAAQRGNVVVHHDDPFLGCGAVEQGWSFSMTLRPRDPSGIRPEEPVPIDPVALNRRLKRAIETMRADWLDEGQRVTGLSVRPYVVADGIRDEHDPVIDPETGMPYTMADDPTVDAIVASPQGGLRQYLRVVIPVRGKAIRDEHGQVILGAQALGISVSAFVHVAVEGGMLYAEFLGTVLPPLRAECQVADTLRPEKVGSYAVGGVLRGAIVDVAAGPYRLARALGRVARLRWRMHTSIRRSQEFRTHDYGARISVRDLASAPEAESYLQRLDGIKYVKLVDRIVGEAIIDHLIENGVDPLEFRQAVNQITLQNSSLVQVGTIQGGQNNFGGDGNVFTTTVGAARA